MGGKDSIDPIASLFAKRDWKPHQFQRDTWQAYAQGHSGLLHAPTGLGKTLAVWMGPVAEAFLENDEPKTCRVLWLTPLRALAQNTVDSLSAPLVELGSGLEVGSRTGDTSAYRRAKLRDKLPFALVTTPESLSLMLTYEDSRQKFSDLRCIVIDEWHELMGSKRGVQTELCLARLRRWAPKLRIWGVSATLGNLREARDVLLGTGSGRGVLIDCDERRPIEVTTMVPVSVDRFPWGGHLGLGMIKRVVEALRNGGSTLVFTNTRSQTEIWHQALLDEDPSLQEKIAVHHGSLGREDRLETERRLMNGELLAVVCTSSLDLGLDFSCIDQVIQVGSPKGVARLLQRAGRSGHGPERVPRLCCVPTNALELLEFAAARDAIEAGEIESRRPLSRPLDVLVQHVTSCTIGEKIAEDDLLQEVRSTHAFRSLTATEWAWVVDFVSEGGTALKAYPQYRKVLRKDGILHFVDKRMIQLHRMNIGTIASDVAISLRMANGRSLGTVEEGFIRKIKSGQAFYFSGRLLELVRLHQLVATVKPCGKTKIRGDIPVWSGGKMPLSTELAHAVARRLEGESSLPSRPEANAVGELLELQRRWSEIPTGKVLQVEHARSRQGEHLFFYTFAGRSVNEGLGALMAHRLSEGNSQSIQVSQNDYGFCLTSCGILPMEEQSLRRAASSENLLPDLLSCLNTHELARATFREVARVAGLIQQMQPGKRRDMKNLQTSSGLLFEVFERYDSGNLLLEQARREVLEGSLELARLRDALQSMESKPLRLIEMDRLSPLAFPLWAERLNFVISSEDASTMIEEMLKNLEKEAEQTLAT